jgi:hypothetical protein
MDQAKASQAPGGAELDFNVFSVNPEKGISGEHKLGS